MQKNFRTKLKELAKEIQRNAGDSNKTYETLRTLEENTGLKVNSYKELKKLLDTDIPARILHRIPNAAKKREMIVEANEFIILHSILTKRGIYKELPINCPRFDYRDIPFKKLTNRLVIEKHMESVVTLFGFDGKPITKELITRHPIFDRQEESIDKLVP